MEKLLKRTRILRTSFRTKLKTKFVTWLSVIAWCSLISVRRKFEDFTRKETCLWCPTITYENTKLWSAFTSSQASSTPHKNSHFVQKYARTLLYRQKNQPCTKDCSGWWACVRSRVRTGRLLKLDSRIFKVELGSCWKLEQNLIAEMEKTWLVPE
jgi:hypothetical protein